MTDCPQEMCPNWGGDGRVCPCALLDLDPPAVILDCAADGCPVPADKPECCTTHRDPLCHYHYRKWHYVEVCNRTGRCEACNREGLPSLLSSSDQL